MTIRARIALLAALAIVLPQLTLLERGGAPEAGMDTAAIALQLEAAPHPSTETAHNALSEIAGDRFTPKAGPAAVPVGLEPSAIAVLTPLTRATRPTPSALVFLPPSRAPPALS